MTGPLYIMSGLPPTLYLRPDQMASPTSSSTSPIGRSAQADVASIVHSIRAVARDLRISGRASEQKLGISGAQLYVLEELNEGEALSINELAARTFTHQSSASTLVSRLVERRLVTRSADRGDARKLSISLTASGRALLKKAPHVSQTRLVAGLRELSRGDLKQLAKNLSVLAESMVGQGSAEASAAHPATPGMKAMRSA